MMTQIKSCPPNKHDPPPLENADGAVRQTGLKAGHEIGPCGMQTRPGSKDNLTRLAVHLVVELDVIALIETGEQ